jgi:hypothetical protein
MTRVVKNSRKEPARETLTEAYEVRAFRDESEEPMKLEEAVPDIQHAEPGAFERVKRMARGHGEQTVLPVVTSSSSFPPATRRPLAQHGSGRCSRAAV